MALMPYRLKVLDSILIGDNEGLLGCPKNFNSQKRKLFLGYPKYWAPYKFFIIIINILSLDLTKSTKKINRFSPQFLPGHHNQNNKTKQQQFLV